jgi:ubiquinone/menaquinone biosynthesis C-methylase UbiE
VRGDWTRSWRCARNSGVDAPVRSGPAREGLEVDWQQADAEDLRYGDGEFDTVLSCLGVMFAPHHRAAAEELVRVCRPGGTLGHVRELLDDRVTDVVARRQSLTVERFADAESFLDFFTADYGRDGIMEWEYLLLTARRQG